MNSDKDKIKKACMLLEISIPYTANNLKKSYYKKALQFHPDKNPNDPVSTKNFQDIVEAYELLTIYIDDMESEVTRADLSYSNMLKKFIYHAIGKKHPDIDLLMRKLTTQCSKISKKLIDNIDDKTLFKIHDYLSNYGDLMNIDTNVIQFFKEEVQKRVHDCFIYVLNPCIDDLLNQEVYKLEKDSRIYYVPLWHEEIQYDNCKKCTTKENKNNKYNISPSSETNNTVIVRCVPDLPQHVTIDHHNNININLSLSISTLLDQEYINFELGKKLFQIPVKKLFIRPLQTYSFYESGIPKISIQDIYNCKDKSDVIAHIYLHE